MIVKSINLVVGKHILNRNSHLSHLLPGITVTKVETSEFISCFFTQKGKKKAQDKSRLTTILSIFSWMKHV